MLSARNYIRLLFGVALAALFVWVAITGKPGSLLGAILTPGSMAQISSSGSSS